MRKSLLCRALDLDGYSCVDCCRRMATPLDCCLCLNCSFARAMNLKIILIWLAVSMFVQSIPIVEFIDNLLFKCGINDIGMLGIVLLLQFGGVNLLNVN